MTFAQQRFVPYFVLIGRAVLEEKILKFRQQNFWFFHLPGIETKTLKTEYVAPSFIMSIYLNLSNDERYWMLNFNLTSMTNKSAFMTLLVRNTYW